MVIYVEVDAKYRSGESMMRAYTSKFNPDRKVTGEDKMDWLSKMFQPCTILSWTILA